MLEEDYRAELSRLVAEIPCEVALPPQWRDSFFSETGVMATIPDERRRFARHRTRTRNVLETETTLPSFERQSTRGIVMLRDISRWGVGFLHAEQLYPLEHCRLWLPTRKATVRVTACRKFGPQCYLIGAQFTRAEETTTE